MQFSRMRLHGFKSFVEPIDLHIPAGLTGIVGPNGCGKSNLVEALRWVMGENSPKRMRGTEMDDVIFGGTATRPSRNIAEVMLELDNSNRGATAEFNNDDTLIVTRQIERGSGSDYRINGKPVRQRDVQLLFADQATGAHSTNLVGQGQIDALIRAKPEDRRQILEEASGTSGLHARRHEAELKLKAAEQNLLRVDDVLKAYDQQLRSLKQQVRQASRYRNLADHIRRAEAALLHWRWLENMENADTIRKERAAAEARAHELLELVTAGNTRRLEAASNLPGLRHIEAAAAAVVQKLNLTKDALENEAKRIADETANLGQRLAQSHSDLARERAYLTDGEQAIIKLHEEQKIIHSTSEASAQEIPLLTERLASLTEAIQEHDRALVQLMQTLAHNDARRQALHTELEGLSARQANLSSKRTLLDNERIMLAAEASQNPDLSLAKANVEKFEAALLACQQDVESAESLTIKAEERLKEHRTAVQEAMEKVTKLKAEAEAIATFLHHDNEQTEQIIDLITVTPGFENALAVALGEALTATLDPHASMHWRVMEPLEDQSSLPETSTPLGHYIKAPKALERALSHIGLVDDQKAGEAIATQLKAGQIVVSRDGWAWRWDGLTVTPEAKTSTAIRLLQRNRMNVLSQEIPSAEADVVKVQVALNECEREFNQSQANDRLKREAVKAAFSDLQDAQENYARQERETLSLNARLTTLSDNIQQIQESIEEIKARAHVIDTEKLTLIDTEIVQKDIDQRRILLSEKRTSYAQQQSERDRLVREEALNNARQKVIVEEITAWQTRTKNAAQQIETLVSRIAKIEVELEQLKARPAAMEESRTQLLSELSDAEAKRRLASDTLMESEQKLADIERQVKQDEQNLNHVREERIRAEGKAQTADEHFATLRERMAEKLNCGPEELLSIAAYGPDETIPPASELEQVLLRYLRERDNIGPVNLRAEGEADTLQNSIDSLQKEKNDLEAAIAKLRQGIQQLNREARERLNNAFTQVNEKFQILFKRLFVGGRAYLELIDNEDPMEAGLEIFASPPGKKMQVLSLLSGGERTLTALALLFAVFQTNPSPICVLDEAEAALDEGNIDRFCSLVEDIAKETGTRFLIITHQRLTMARMDHLYGVTMGEKGVSQLVSVDLAGAVALRDRKKPEQQQLLDAEQALEAVRAA